MIIGFTGTQMGMNNFQKTELVKIIRLLDIGQAHHGMCIGADEEFEELVRQNSLTAVIHGHPPKNTSKMSTKSRPDYVYQPADYLVRNHHIVDCCELLIAAPFTADEQLRSGTWATLRYAYRTHRGVRIIRPS